MSREKSCLACSSQISSEHAVIYIAMGEGGQHFFSIADSGSTNGTWLQKSKNDKVEKLSTKLSYSLEHEMLLKFGNNCPPGNIECKFSSDVTDLSRAGSLSPRKGLRVSFPESPLKMTVLKPALAAAAAAKATAIMFDAEDEKGDAQRTWWWDSCVPLVLQLLLGFAGLLIGIGLAGRTATAKHGRLQGAAALWRFAAASAILLGAATAAVRSMRSLAALLRGGGALHAARRAPCVQRQRGLCV